MRPYSFQPGRIRPFVWFCSGIHPDRAKRGFQSADPAARSGHEQNINCHYTSKYHSCQVGGPLQVSQFCAPRRRSFRRFRHDGLDSQQYPDEYCRPDEQGRGSRSQREGQGRGEPVNGRLLRSRRYRREDSRMIRSASSAMVRDSSTLPALSPGMARSAS